MPDIYKSKDWVKDKALISKDDYKKLYSQSITDPLSILGRTRYKRLDWYTPYTKIRDYSYDINNLYIKWYEDGVLKCISYNCIDRHIEKMVIKLQYFGKGDDPADTKKITYKELLIEVCRFSNGLKSIGIKKGDRVTIYMPMIPEASSCYACMYQNWSNSFGCFWRVFS
jgi:acetyl-CoA synthetase